MRAYWFTLSVRNVRSVSLLAMWNNTLYFTSFQLTQLCSFFSEISFKFTAFSELMRQSNILTAIPYMAVISIQS